MAALIPEVGALVAGRYRIRGIASDGPGYLTLHAFDREIEVEVSLLWFRPGLFPDKRARQGFVGEAVRARGLAHPHLRRLYDPHIEGDSVFVAAQVGSAAQILKRLDSARPIDELEIIRYASAVGQGLEVAHRIGAVHGYLVPADIVEVASQIKVSGVGLYAAASPDVARDLFWTRRKYIAPEVLRGDIPSPASDVYSMAVLLTELASGISGPELSESAEALATQHIRLADIFARASRADPAARTQTVSALLAEVRRSLVDDRVPTSERPAVQPPPDVDLLADYESAQTAVHHSRPDSEDEGTQVVAARRPDSEDGETVTRQRSDLIGAPEGSEGASSRPGFAGSGRPDLIGAPEGSEGASSRPGFAGSGRPEMIDVTGDPLGDDPVTSEIPAALGDTDKTTEYRPVPPADDDDEYDDDDLEPELIIVDSPPRERAAGKVEVAFELSPKTIQGVAPASPPPAFETEAPAKPEFVSHKPAETDTPRTPHLPVLDRPDGKVKVRPIPSRAPSQGPQLGNYAPPRSSTASPPRRERRRGLLFFLWTFAGLVAVVLGALIAVVVVRGDRHRGRPAVVPPVQDAAVAIPDASIAAIDAAPRPCPEDMALTGEGDKRFCVDLYEAPGRGKLPAVRVGRPEAEARCASRGARLCSRDEWEIACRGATGSDFPYGSRYEKGRCNGGRGIRAEIAVAGTFPECVSASGAFDMSGNVAEWSAEGYIHGGSARDRSSGRCNRRYRGSRQAEGYPDVGYRCCADPDPAALAPAEPGR